MANTPDLEGHIRKIETMYKVSEREIDAIVRLTVLFYHTKQIGILELSDTDTDPSENLQENGATLPVGTSAIAVALIFGRHHSCFIQASTMPLI